MGFMKPSFKYITYAYATTYLCACMCTRANAYVNINVFGTGLFLPYSIGVIGYIKKHIPIEDYKITGISGGAWCSLLYTQEDDLSKHDVIWDYAIGKNISKISLYGGDLVTFQKNIETNMKNRYASKYASIAATPKHLDKITIVSTNVNKLYDIHNEKMSDFKNMNDLIDSCVCSSYIPYLSGNSFSKKYNGNSYIDGEVNNINRYRELTTVSNDTISIHRKMWGRKFELSNYLYLDKKKSRELFEYGWEDTDKNKMNLLR
jgi:hypothetical protein